MRPEGSADLEALQQQQRPADQSPGADRGGDQAEVARACDQHDGPEHDLDRAEREPAEGPPSPGPPLDLERACQPQRPGQDRRDTKSIHQDPGGYDRFQEVTAQHQQPSDQADHPGQKAQPGARLPPGPQRPGQCEDGAEQPVDAEEVHQRRPVASGGDGKDPKGHGDRAPDRRDPPQAPGRRRATAVFAERSRLAAARAAGGHRSVFTVARATRHPLGAGGAGAGCGGGLPISSIRPSATSSRTAITMVTAAVGWPQKTKISAASATAPIRSACRCA